MSDDALRELERRYKQTGALEDEVAWLSARLRAGQLSLLSLRLSAFAGRPGPAQVVGSELLPAGRPTPELQAALRRFAEASGVVQHHLFEPPGEPDDREAHQLVALLTAQAFGGERAGYLLGSRVSLDELFGERVDRARRCLLFPSPAGLLPAAEAAASRRAGSGWGSGLGPGYGRAFSEPPYSLRCPLEEADRLFSAVWSGIGSWEEDQVVVFAWSTDNLRGFGAGRDWWGSALWTVAPRDGRPWAGIAASATD